MTMMGESENREEKGTYVPFITKCVDCDGKHQTDRELKRRNRDD